MKIEIEESDKKYIYIVIGLIFFITLSMFQYYSNKGLSEDIKKREAENKEQKEDIKSLKATINSYEVEKGLLLNKVDSIKASEDLFKNKYYATNNKLKNILSSYNDASDDDKWDAFTNALKE